MSKAGLFLVLSKLSIAVFSVLLFSLCLVCVCSVFAVFAVFTVCLLFVSCVCCVFAVFAAGLFTLNWRIVLRQYLRQLRLVHSIRK
jgi:hypothetical protein